MHSPARLYAGPRRSANLVNDFDMPPTDPERLLPDDVRGRNAGGLSSEIASAPRPRLTPLDLFLGFAQVALSGFGGTMFWMRRILIDRRGWLDDREFVETLAIAQILPGANMVNLTAIFGYRNGGLRGLIAAMGGFLGPPFLIVLALGALYQHYGELPLVRRALAGMSAVAAGLIFASCMQLASALPRTWLPWLFGVLAFAGLGVLRLPLVLVLGVLGPFAILIAWKGRL